MRIISETCDVVMSKSHWSDDEFDESEDSDDDDIDDDFELYDLDEGNLLRGIDSKTVRK